MKITKIEISNSSLVKILGVLTIGWWLVVTIGVFTAPVECYDTDANPDELCRFGQTWWGQLIWATWVAVGTASPVWVGVFGVSAVVRLIQIKKS